MDVLDVYVDVDGGSAAPHVAEILHGVSAVVLIAGVVDE